MAAATGMAGDAMSAGLLAVCFASNRNFSRGTRDDIDWLSKRHESPSPALTGILSPTGGEERGEGAIPGKLNALWYDQEPRKRAAESQPAEELLDSNKGFCDGAQVECRQNGDDGNHDQKFREAHPTSQFRLLAQQTHNATYCAPAACFARSVQTWRAYSWRNGSSSHFFAFLDTVFLLNLPVV